MKLITRIQQPPPQNHKKKEKKMMKKKRKMVMEMKMKLMKNNQSFWVNLTFLLITIQKPTVIPMAKSFFHWKKQRRKK